MPNCISLENRNNLALFPDDAKIFHTITSIQDEISFNKDLDNLLLWSKTWQMKFNSMRYYFMVCSTYVSPVPHRLPSPTDF